MRNVTIKFANSGKEISEIKAEEVDLLEIIEYARKLKKMSSTDVISTKKAPKVYYSKKGVRGPQWTVHDLMIGVNLLRKSSEHKNGRELIRLIRENGDCNNRKAGGIRMMANRLYHYLYIGDPLKAGMSESTIQVLKNNGIVMNSMLSGGIKVPVTYNNKKEYLPSLTPREA